MSKIVGSETTLEFMVNCKTYPAVSKKYIETVCTGGVQASGEFVRLYPVPFRLLDENEKYDRWDLVRVQAYKDTKDTRPESWHLMQGTPIEFVENISTEKRRWDWMQHTVHSSTGAMSSKGITNGCVEIEPIEFYWKADDQELSKSQMQVVQQQNLFVSSDVLQLLADRPKWQYRLKYREVGTGKEVDSKVLAWSYYQGIRQNLKKMSEKEALEATADRVRQSIFNSKKTIFGIFGTHSRFNHWMISAIYHVPTKIAKQESLF
ncbi:MAG: hypothetical protein R3C03_04255 [Pirellulaceae bacterium]